MLASAETGSNTISSNASQAAAARQRQEEAARERQQELEQERQQELARQQKLAEEALKLLQEASQHKTSEARALAAVKSAGPTGLPNLHITDSSRGQIGAENKQLAVDLDREIQADALSDPQSKKAVQPEGSPAPVELSQQTIDETVAQLHTAIDGKEESGSTLPADPVVYGRFGAVGTAGPTEKRGPSNEGAVSRLLADLTQAQKQQIESVYKNKYHTELMTDVGNHFDTTNQLKIKDIIDRPDGEANYAGDLAVMISQTNSNHNSANGAIMQYLATMSSSQIATMESQYKREFGTSFTSALDKNGNLGQDIQHALPLLLKGADKRTAADDEQLVKVVANYGGTDGVDLVEAALGGTSKASSQARSDIAHDKSLMQQLDSQYGGQQLAEVNDFVNNGQISLTTIINADHKDTANLVHALSTATAQERQQFTEGQLLAESGQKPKTASDKQALDYYEQVHKALSAAGNKTEVVEWEDQLTTGGSIIGQLAANSKNSTDLMHAVESMSEQDWQSLTNPQTGEMMRAQLVASLKEYATPKEQKQVLTLLNEKIQAGSYADSQMINQPFLDAVAQDKSQSNVTFAIQHFGSADAQKYKTDAQFRAQVDKVVDGLTGPKKTLAESLLSQVGKTGEPAVPTAADTALADIVNGSDKATTLKAIQQALQSDPELLKSFADYQKVNETEASGTGAGHITAQGLRELRSLPKGTLSSSEQALLNYAQKNMGASEAAQLFSSGNISLQEQSKLRFSKTYVFSQLAKASSSEQSQFLSTLKPDQRQLAEAYISSGGKPAVADQIRSYVLGDDSNFSQIGQELQSMTPAQKTAMFNEYTQKYGSNLENDLLSKLPPTERQNYQDLLSLTKVSAQTDYANALIDNGDHQQNVEDGTAYTSIRATQEFADALQQANAFHQALTPEQLEQFNSTIAQAQQDYQAAVAQYSKDHPGFWGEVEHIAENVAVVVASTAVTFAVGAVTCGVGGAIAGGLTYALLSQAVNVANGGNWNWANFGEQAAIGVVFAAGGAAVGAAKGVLAGAAAGAAEEGGEAAAATVGESFIEGGSAVASDAAETGGDTLVRSAGDVGEESAVRTGADAGEESAVRSAATETESAAEKQAFATKLAAIAMRQAKLALIMGGSNVGISAAATELEGGKLSAGTLLHSFENGAVTGVEFGLAGEALAPVFSEFGPALFRAPAAVPESAPLDTAEGGGSSESSDGSGNGGSAKGSDGSEGSGSGGAGGDGGSAGGGGGSGGEAIDGEHPDVTPTPASDNVPELAGPDSGDTQIFGRGSGGNSSQSFVDSATAPRRVITVDGQHLTEGSPVSVGRSDGAGIKIPDSTVSSTHAYLYTNDQGQTFIQDADSTNGTTINGKPIEAKEWYQIKAGDRVSVSGHQLQFGSSLEPTYEAAVGSSLVALKPGEEIQLGRGKLGVQDGAVSRDHLTLGMDDNGIYISEDAGKPSTNGTYVNGERIKPGERIYLKSTDEVQLGSTGSDSERLNLIPTEVLKPPEDFLSRDPARAAEAVKQSNYYATHHEINSPLEDGFEYGGKYTTYDENGDPVGRARQAIVVVDRADDPVLRDVIADAKENFGGLPPKEKAAALVQYVNSLLKPANMSESGLNEWVDEFNKAHAGDKVLLGEFISEGKGVCAQQGLLYKVLGDELGLDVTYVRGNGGPPLGVLNHAWDEVKLPGEKEPLVYDPRQGKVGATYDELKYHQKGIDLKGMRNPGTLEKGHVYSNG